jgi:hypothetical protein
LGDVSVISATTRSGFECQPFSSDDICVEIQRDSNSDPLNRQGFLVARLFFLKCILFFFR